MLPNPKFKDRDLEFWANIKLLNQRLGYSERTTKKNPKPNFIVPTREQIIEVFTTEGLDYSKLILGSSFTEFGELIREYMEYRGFILKEFVEPNLMNKVQAKKLFYEMKEDISPSCPLPYNKQKNEKKDYAYLTGIVNMLIEQNKGTQNCDYDPKELTAITRDRFPLRTLSRRVDGAFPGVIDPIAIWEIKEYYYTTTFGSRVADGVYETQLDGWELREAYKVIDREIRHYLFVDDHFTWWVKGKSYLCRIIDSMHMGLLTEAVFGKEAVQRIPEIVTEWNTAIEIRKKSKLL